MQPIFHLMRGLSTKLCAVLAVAALTLTACAPATETSSSPLSLEHTPQASAEFLADHGLTGLNAKQIIDTLDAVPVAERSQELIAVVRPGELLLSDSHERELSMPLPPEKFYLSVAPFVTHTHDCYFHSLTTCMGELANTDVKVTFTDLESRTKLLDEELSTFDNGFVGLWLPSGIRGTLTIETAGRTASTEVSTTSMQDATCLTTMRLA